MSYPTPGSDPNVPQGGAPQGQPGWGAPQRPGYDPAPSYSGGPAGYGSPTGRRPGVVTGAAVTGIVWGALGTLFGLVVLGAAFDVSGLLGVLVLLSAVLSVALLVGGIFILTGRPPRLLLFTCYVALAINLISLIISVAKDGGNASNGVLGFVIPGVVIGLLFQQQSKQYFAARGQSY
jgi:hypothetical protein